MSEHQVSVVRIQKILPHPNADRLEIIPVFGYQCISQKGTWKVGDLAAYIEPESIVPDTEEYAWLNGHRRIKAKRLRGVWSQGLLMPAPAGAQEGDNVMDVLGITHYDPELPGVPRGPSRGFDPDAEQPTDLLKTLQKYDVQNFRRYNYIFQPGEMLHVSEKIHGTNARFVWHENRMWIGSRTTWKKPEADTVWSRALQQNPWIEDFCKSRPLAVLFGEVYGPHIQGVEWSYGRAQGEYGFLAFDVYDLVTNKFWDAGMLDNENVLTPHRTWVSYDGDPKSLEALAEAPSNHQGKMREGVVIKPLQDRSDIRLGRVLLKLVSNAYLEHS